MPLTILKGGTPSVTGGTSQTFTPGPAVIVGGVVLQDTSVADFRIRPQLTVKAKLPALVSDGSYTKQKNSVTLSLPQILASGKTVFNLVRIEVEVHPELSSVNAAELRYNAAQLLYDTDLSNFWVAGQLSF